MADHSKPVLTSTYANFVTELDARFDDLAVGLDPAFTTVTNMPTNSIRWSSASNLWQRWTGLAWEVLSTGYDIDIANGSIVNSPISGSTGSFTTLAASGAFSLTGDQVQVSEGGTGATTAATARANLGAAPTASPTFSGTATFGKIASATLFAGAGGTEGGELWLEKPVSGSTINGNGVLDISSDAIRFFESGGTSRGAYIYLPSCAGGVGSAIWHQGNDGAGSGLDADLLDGQQGSYYAPLSNPSLTGVPVAPTAVAGTNTTQLATTAFVQSATPAGLVAFFARSTAPTGFLKANGAAISRTTYATLFSAIGTAFGVGNGSTTFNVPDLRGEFIRGWDDARGVDSGRAFGSAQAEAFAAHTHKYGNTHNTGYGLSATGTVGTNPAAAINYDTGSTGGSETRPRNIALLACIKY